MEADQIGSQHPADRGLCLLKEKYAIDYKFHSEMPWPVLLKYNQISSPMSEPIVQECRGLILDSRFDDWPVVCFPFVKFFNHGQTEAAKIDWKTAKVQEKLDGSLINMWCYDGMWRISTSGCPDGLNKVGDRDLTFADLFWRTFVKQGGRLEAFNQHYTYMFELTSPLNRVVVDYKHDSVTLIGIRDNFTFKELPVHSEGGISAVKEYPLNSLEACIAAAKGLNPLQNEGYVVVDSAFRRIKVKNPQYVAIHHLYSSFSLKNLAEAIRKGEFEELCVAFNSYPQYMQDLFRLNARYNSVIQQNMKIFEQIKDVQPQKEYARVANMQEHPSILFALRKTGLSVAEILAKMTTNAYLNVMDIK